MRDPESTGDGPKRRRGSREREIRSVPIPSETSGAAVGIVGSWPQCVARTGGPEENGLKAGALYFTRLVLGTVVLVLELVSSEFSPGGCSSISRSPLVVHTPAGVSLLSSETVATVG